MIARSRITRSSLRKHQLYLEPDLPVGGVIRSLEIVVGRELRIYRQLAQVEDLTDAAARHNAAASAAFVPGISVPLVIVLSSSCSTLRSARRPVRPRGVPLCRGVAPGPDHTALVRGEIEFGRKSMYV